MSIKLISIIIPCRNEFEYVEAAINSVLSQKNVPCAMEILVADGDSDDGTTELLLQMAEKDSRIKIIRNPLRIVSTGLNECIRVAQGEIIVRMDMHSIYSEDYVSQCLAVLLSTNAENVGGAARTMAKTYFQHANAIAYHSLFGVGGARFHNADYEGWVDTVTYGCWRKDTLMTLGLFDEALVRNQDDELNLRLTRSGGKVWQSKKIISWYFPRATLGKLFKQYSQYGYWKVAVIRKHRLPASFRHLVPGAFVFSLIASAFLAFIFDQGMYLFLALSFAYLLASIFASLISCLSVDRWKYIPIMPLVFSAYHIGYGWGFLNGVYDLIFKNKFNITFSKVTR